jgi:predicted GNAT family acetyltransferase
MTDMTEAPYTVSNNEKEMQFEIAQDGLVAYLTYRYYKNDIAFMHTFVPKPLEGKGMASALAVAAFAFAKASGHLVMVYCPYVAAFLKRHPEYQVQVDKQYH